MNPTQVATRDSIATFVRSDDEIFEVVRRTYKYQLPGASESLLNLRWTLSGQDLPSRRTTRLLIDGEWVEVADGATFETVNPANEEILMRCAAADAEDVDAAVAAAARAAEGPWKRMTPAERGRVLWRVADLLERDADALAQLEVLDMGKPLRLAREDDLPMAIDHFRYYAGWTTKLEEQPSWSLPGPISTTRFASRLGSSG